MKRFLILILTIFAFAGCKTEDEPVPKPVADFYFSVSVVSPTEQVITLTDNSKYADRVEWSTNAGTYSSGNVYSLHVTRNARYIVTLTAKNSQGQDTKTENIDITTIATTGQNVFWSQIGNRGDISIYVNGSYQGKLTKYMQSDNAPSCGLQGFVTVTLPAGSYPFTAQTNELFPIKWSGNFTVQNGSCRSMQLSR